MQENFSILIKNCVLIFSSKSDFQGNAPITPITGRSGILGDQRNNCFTDVQCGTGKNSKYTYCVTKSSLLCMFNEKRVMDKWVELKVLSRFTVTVRVGFHN